MKRDLVIARYREDLSWLDSVSNEVSIALYEKSDLLPPNRVVNKRDLLPNIGNEAHTYIYHIVSNYLDIADITYFVQGRPFDHSPNALDFINGNIVITANYTTMCEVVVTSDSDGLPHHAGLPVGEYYEKIFDKKMDEILHFGAGAQFCATKEAIHSRPIEFWEKLLILSENTDTAPFCFERLWHKIFGC